MNENAPFKDGEGGKSAISDPADPFRFGLGGMNLGADNLAANFGVKECERVWTCGGLDDEDVEGGAVVGDAA